MTQALRLTLGLPKAWLHFDSKRLNFDRPSASPKRCMQLQDMHRFVRKICSSSVILCFLLFHSCKENLKGTLDYKKLHYDSSRITIQNWDTSDSKFPKNSDPLPLTQSNLDLIDSLLRAEVDYFNQEQRKKFEELFKIFTYAPKDSTLFLLQLDNYKIEYFPFNDVNHQDMVIIDCYCNGSEKSKKYESIWGKRRNFCHFTLSVNLKERSWTDISIDYNFG